MPRPLIVAAGFVLAGLFGLGAYFLPVFQTASTTVATGGLGNLDPKPTSTAPFTVLLLGSDDDSKFPPDRLNTQSMILVRVDPGTRQSTMLSIPRDLWVPIPNEGSGKISWAYQLGGAQAAVAAVESNFKVHIDDYAWIGLNGLVKLIDQLGGVNVTVTNPVMDDFYPQTSRPMGIHTGTTGSRSFLALPTSTESTRCSTCARGTETFAGTSPVPNASNRSYLRSRPRHRISTSATCRTWPGLSTARSRRAWG